MDCPNDLCGGVYKNMAGKQVKKGIGEKKNSFYQKGEISVPIISSKAGYDITTKRGQVFTICSK
jgi:hypothetical protein